MRLSEWKHFNDFCSVGHETVSTQGREGNVGRKKGKEKQKGERWSAWLSVPREFNLCSFTQVFTMFSLDGINKPILETSI